MNSESQKERQKMLQREHQQRHLQLKRHGKENIPKRRIEINDPVMTPRACVYELRSDVDKEKTNVICIVLFNLLIEIMLL